MKKLLLTVTLAPENGGIVACRNASRMHGAALLASNGGPTVTSVTRPSGS